MSVNWKALAPGIAAMTVVVTAANILVQIPINDWLTWGAFTYPVSFLVTDLTNRRLGAGAARRVVYAGFAVAVVLSAVLATPRIAAASGLAFLAGQLLDVQIFDILRRRVWWLPPFISSIIASALDTVVFFSIAFAFTPVPWVTLAVGDYGVKLAMALLLLLPFRGFMQIMMPVRQTT
ncbi:MAG TPA: queuosine precursor transporter [Alphaproteobacteria bacterium]|nr:queuosine precursor transporter [Alphaproteobacteria bacterium]